jgi:hypothetical protein
MFRFFPGYKAGEIPDRQQILSEVTGLWERYHLEARTRLGTKLEKIVPVTQGSQSRGTLGQRWHINDASNGPFDAVVLTIGVCGQPNGTDVPFPNAFEGEILRFSQAQEYVEPSLLGRHQIQSQATWCSSNRPRANSFPISFFSIRHHLRNRRVLILGHGAEAVDALDLAIEYNAKDVRIVADEDPVVIPRSPIIRLLEKIDASTAAIYRIHRQGFGAQVCEWLVKIFYSRDVPESLGQAVKERFWHQETVVTHPDTNHNELQLLFVNVDCHSKGVGFAAWQAIEALHPETEIWETHTPYFEQRNIHFYINKCGFHMVEFFCKAHPEPGEDYPDDVPGGDGFCRFEKRMK